MDEKRVNARGLEPLRPLLRDIDRINSNAALQEMIGRLHDLQLFVPFGVVSSPDNHNPSHVLARVFASGLGLPDRDYYLKPDERFADAREKYVVHAAKMFEHAGTGKAAAKQQAGTVLAFETRLAKWQLDNVALRDPRATDHKYRVATLQKMTPHFDWPRYLDRARLIPIARANCAWVRPTNRRSAMTSSPDSNLPCNQAPANARRDGAGELLRRELRHHAASDRFRRPETDDHLAAVAVVVRDLPLVRVRERVPLADVDLEARVQLGVRGGGSSDESTAAATGEIHRVRDLRGGEVENKSGTGHAGSVEPDCTGECALPHVQSPYGAHPIRQRRCRLICTSAQKFAAGTRKKMATTGTMCQLFFRWLRRRCGSPQFSSRVLLHLSLAYDAWPRARLLDALGPDPAGRVPADFHPTRVAWSIPIFIVRAMEHQAAADWRRDPRVLTGITPNHTAARGVDDFVSDLLFNEIRPETIVAFRGDPAFLAAYNFPSRDYLMEARTLSR